MWVQRCRLRFYRIRGSTNLTQGAVLPIVSEAELVSAQTRHSKSGDGPGALLSGYSVVVLQRVFKNLKSLPEGLEVKSGQNH